MADDPALRDLGADPVAVRSVYDQWAADYEHDVGRWSYDAPDRLVARLLDLAPDTTSVVDIGCGTGLVGRALAAAGVTDVIGVDLSPASLERAAATGAYRTTVAADLQQLPSPLGSGIADAVLCVGVMTYLPETAATIGEFLRIVRSGRPVGFTQRIDLWEERGDADTIARLEAAGELEVIEISDPLPYLPGNEEMGDIEVRMTFVRRP